MGDADRMTGLRWLAAVVAVWALLAPAAHLLEMPNKLALDGPLWLAIQQSLYRGWGPLVGAPSEFAGLALGLVLWFRTGRSHPARKFHAIAAGCYAVMISIFFVFNAPVNEAVNGWTATTLAGDWPSYRLRWEVGHALSAILAMVALFSAVKAAVRAAPAARPAAT